MEQINTLELAPIEVVRPSDSLGNGKADSHQPFITANTVESSLEEIKKHHIIPVFTKDNEPLISHSDFIEITADVIGDAFGDEFSQPQIRLSHPVKGRIPEAKDKPASELLEREKTIYYERMMFVIEIPSVVESIEGSELSLTVGGVKSYTQDNLYSRSMCDQHFKVFIGFKNKVCTNLCIWTDGLLDDLKVKNAGQLKASLKTLIENYNQNQHLFHLRKLVEHSITEQQFAQIAGRCRMYNHLPSELKKEIPVIPFGDQQINTVVKDYYSDKSFCRDDNGNINLWRLYNLFTNANKATYIDSFLNRSAGAYSFVEQIRWGLEGKNSSWYLN